MRVEAARPAFLVLALGLSAAPTLADPCEAALPNPRAAFTGPVVYIGDGDSLCVAATPGRTRDPATWIEVRLADIDAPELRDAGGARAKRDLEQIAMGRRVRCRADHRSYDRVVAWCVLASDGQPLASHLSRVRR